MQKYMMIALLYTTVTFGGQMDIVPAQAPMKQYAKLWMGTTPAGTVRSYIPAAIEKNLQQHRIAVAELVDEPNGLSIADEMRKFYEALFDVEYKDDASESIAAPALQPETNNKAAFQRRKFYYRRRPYDAEYKDDASESIAAPALQPEANNRAAFQRRKPYYRKRPFYRKPYVSKSKNLSDNSSPNEYSPASE